MSTLSDILRSVAPTIATALGGPLAGAAVGFLSSKLGVDPTIIQQTVAGMAPADLVKMKELDLQFQLEMARNGISIDLAQIGVNVEEAKSANWWVAGWRPAVGWVCATALAYVTVIEPIARFTAKVGFSYGGDFPAVDLMSLMPVLLGILGLGALRTTEKVQGGVDNH